MIDIAKLKEGYEVRYQPSHYGERRCENGIVKQIPDFATDPEALGFNCIRVVYNCGGDWKNYRDYTSALTNLRDLKLGWKE